MAGNSSARDNLGRTMKKMHRLLVLLTTGISHRHCLFNHNFCQLQLSTLFDNYYTSSSVECKGIKSKFGVSCALIIRTRKPTN